MKLNELQHKRALQDNPELQSPTDALREMLMPKKPKIKPTPQMKVLSNNGELLGDGKVVKGAKGMKAFDPYGSKKTRGLNPHKVVMGQGAGMMGNGNTQMLKDNPKKANKHQHGGQVSPYNTSVLNAHRPKGATDAVARYQAMLNAKYGLTLAIDGAWGRATQEAYEKYVLPEQNAKQIHQQALKLSDGSKPSALPFNNTGGTQPATLPIQKPYTSGGLQSAGVTAQPGWGVR